MKLHLIDSVLSQNLKSAKNRCEGECFNIETMHMCVEWDALVFCWFCQLGYTYQHFLSSHAKFLCSGRGFANSFWSQDTNHKNHKERYAKTAKHHNKLVLGKSIKTHLDWPKIHYNKKTIRYSALVTAFNIADIFVAKNIPYCISSNKRHSAL